MSHWISAYWETNFKLLLNVIKLKKKKALQKRCVLSVVDNYIYPWLYSLNDVNKYSLPPVHGNFGVIYVDVFWRQVL
jgi:hypothetical protein